MPRTPPPTPRRTTPRAARPAPAREAEYKPIETGRAATPPLPLVPPQRRDAAFDAASALFARASAMCDAASAADLFAQAAEALRGRRDEPDRAVYAYDRLVAYANLVVVLDGADRLDEARRRLARAAAADPECAPHLRAQLAHLPLFEPPPLPLARR